MGEAGRVSRMGRSQPSQQLVTHDGSQQKDTWWLPLPGLSPHSSGGPCTCLTCSVAAPLEHTSGPSPLPSPGPPKSGFLPPSTIADLFVRHVLGFKGKGFPGDSAGKEFTCNVGDLGSIPGLGRSPGEGNNYLLQYSSLENSMDCIVLRVAKNWTQLRDFH